MVDVLNRVKFDTLVIIELSYVIINDDNGNPYVVFAVVQKTMTILIK